MKLKVIRKKSKEQERKAATRRRVTLWRARLLQSVSILSFALCVLPFSFCLAQPRVPVPHYGPMRDKGQKQEVGLPVALQKVSIDQRLNEQVPLDLVFRDETGKEVRLGDYFSGNKPVILSLVFYECPMLCNQVLNGLVSGLRAVPLSVGDDFNVVTVSFDPRETAELAARKKEIYMHQYKRAGASAGWHFLTGDEASIKQLTDAVGFRYTYDPAANQFAHASGIMILTPQGKISRYFYGIEYAPKDVRLSLVEASGGKIGSRADQLLLYCYHYDPSTGKYAWVMNIYRLGGILTVLGMIALFFVLRRRNFKRVDSVELGGTT